MRNNTAKLEALSRKLNRTITHCEVCGKNLQSILYYIKYENRHSGMAHQLEVVCQACNK